MIINYFREGDDENYYYSTKLQLQELMEVLDPNDLEYELYRTIEDFKDEIIRQMDITEKLTNSAKGNKKSYLEVENGMLLKLCFYMVWMFLEKIEKVLGKKYSFSKNI